MYAISNKRMNLLHFREVNDYDEELIIRERKNGLVWMKEWFSLNFDQ